MFQLRTSVIISRLSCSLSPRNRGGRDYKILLLWRGFESVNIQIRMSLLITKYLVTAFVIVVVSEIARRTDRMGALIAALPFVTIMVMVWLHLEKQGMDKIANHAYFTFWYVIPTLPMFLAMPWLLAKGLSFWLALALCIVLTIICYLLTAWIAHFFGVNLIP